MQCLACKTAWSLVIDEYRTTDADGLQMKRSVSDWDAIRKLSRCRNKGFSIANGDTIVLCGPCEKERIWNFQSNGLRVDFKSQEKQAIIKFLKKANRRDKVQRHAPSAESTPEKPSSKQLKAEEELPWNSLFE